MGKRRTRKEKEKAIHSFAISWSPEANSKVDVKGHFNSEAKKASAKAGHQENAMLLAKEASLKLIKKDIFKSLILASLIVIFEVVLYLAWHTK